VKANAEIDKFKKGLMDTHGNMETLQKRAEAVGLSFKENWGHQGQAGLAAFSALVKEFENRWAALNEELEASNEQLDGLIDKAADLGYEFDRTGNFTGVNFDKLTEKAEEFGVSVDGLGPAFRQQGINAEAKKIIDGFELMAKAGGDVGGILFGMKDEIGELVGESIKMGTTIPANMKPWIEELHRTGQLTDENGDKIADLSQIKFGDPIKTEFEMISSAIKELIDKIGSLIDAIAAIPTQKDITVTTHHQQTGTPSTGLEGGGGFDGSVGELPHFSTGTLGRLGSFWGQFPAGGMAAMLDGVEAVVTPQQSVPFAMDVMSGLMAGAQAQAAPQASKPVQLQQAIDNKIIMDGREMKRWVMDTFATAIENNEGGTRTKFRDLLGVTT